MKYNVRINDTVYEVEVVKGNAQLLSEYKAINAEPAKDAPKTAAPTVAAPVAAAPAAANTAVNGNAVTAPLPGTVAKILVTVGQKVNAGDVVAIIEAMKMENDITAATGGTVTAIPAVKGAQISVGEPIVILA